MPHNRGGPDQKVIRPKSTRIVHNVIDRNIDVRDKQLVATVVCSSARRNAARTQYRLNPRRARP